MTAHAGQPRSADARAHGRRTVDAGELAEDLDAARDQRAAHHRARREQVRNVVAPGEDLRLDAVVHDEVVGLRGHAGFVGVSVELVHDRTRLVVAADLEQPALHFQL